MPLSITTNYATENNKLARTPIYILEFPNLEISSMYAAETISDTPVAGWVLGDAEGASFALSSIVTNPLPGQYIGNPERITGLTAMGGLATVLDGSTQYISVPASSLLGL